MTQVPALETRGSVMSCELENADIRSYVNSSRQGVHQSRNSGFWAMGFFFKCFYNTSRIFTHKLLVYCHIILY